MWEHSWSGILKEGRCIHFEAEMPEIEDEDEKEKIMQ